MSGVGNETLDAGTRVPAKAEVKSGCASTSGLGMSGGAGAGNGKGESRDGSRRAGLLFACAERNPPRATGLGQDAPTSPSGVVGRLEDKPMSRCCWSARAAELVSIMAAMDSPGVLQYTVYHSDEARHATGTVWR